MQINILQKTYETRRDYSSPTAVYYTTKLQCFITSCQCVKLLRVNAKSSLIAYLLQFTPKESLCFFKELYTRFSRKLYTKPFTTYLVYVPVANLVYKELIDLLTKSIHYRNNSNLVTKWFNFTKPSDILSYILLLAEEYAIYTNLGIIKNPDTLRKKHYQYYEVYYNYFDSLTQIENKDYHLKHYFNFINPIYSFNITHCYKITQCLYRSSDKGVIFVPFLDNFNDLITFDVNDERHIYIKPSCKS